MPKNICPTGVIVSQDSLRLQLTQVKKRIRELCNVVQQIEEKVDSTIDYQANKIIELESYVDPYSNDGEAICNFHE